mgnify:CR=1 FL=1
MNIRKATVEDDDAVWAVHESAFPEKERERIAACAAGLLDTDLNPGAVSWVAEVEGEVVGHVAFSPLIDSSSNSVCGSILAPVAVKKTVHGKGIGRALIEHGICHERGKGVEVLVVYGDPEFYGRFGFTAEAAEAISPPYDLEHPFGWQGIDFRKNKQKVMVQCVASLQDPELW